MSDSLKLKKSLFGFKKRSVLSYIDMVSKNVDDKLFMKDNEIKKLKKNIEDLKEQIKSLNGEIDSFKEEKNKLSQMYIHAEETSDKIIKEAEQKAEQMISDADSEILRKNEEFNSEHEKKKSEYALELENKKAQITACKSEIKCLQDKIKITLDNFEKILSDVVN